MAHKAIVHMLVLAAVCYVGTQQIARAEIVLESSTFSLGELVLRDNFDDNQQGLLWRAYLEDPNNCWVQEVNERLELQSTDQANNSFAGYVADSWRLNPEEDFALRIDFHHDLLNTWGGSWVNLGITTTPYDLDAHRVTMGVGCNNRFPYYWYEKKNGASVNSSYIWRSLTDGSIYISYKADEDVLYVGDAGYEPEDAWMTFNNLLQGEWGGQPVYVYFGGRTNMLQVDSGHAYLDNLFVEVGTVIEAALQEVYRFWSSKAGTHFYTMSEVEKEKLLKNYADVWVYEGVAYRAYPDETDSDVSPVYRFWSPTALTHFYTISADERDKLIDKFGELWTYEGVAFYAYKIGDQPDWTMPVYRFWSDARKTHFFTITESERDKLLDDSGAWTYEGIAWYAGE